MKSESTKKTVQKYLLDILEYSVLICDSFEGVREGDFAVNRDLQHMTLRRLSVIGEVVKRIPEQYKLRYPDVEWRNIAGMRDMISHDYDGIDMATIWETVQDGIPKLVRQIEKMIVDGDYEYEEK